VVAEQIAVVSSLGVAVSVHAVFSFGFGVGADQDRLCQGDVAVTVCAVRWFQVLPLSVVIRRCSWFVCGFSFRLGVLLSPLMSKDYRLVVAGP
jgi:hypothetical protein